MEEYRGIGVRSRRGVSLLSLPTLLTSLTRFTAALYSLHSLYSLHVPGAYVTTPQPRAARPAAPPPLSMALRHRCACQGA